MLYFVSEYHFLSSSVHDGGSWFQDPTLGNFRTEMNTRSLSITSVNNTVINSTTNSALLYYENPTGNVSALLQRISPQPTQILEMLNAQWIDISSQESKSLPDEFRNVPGFNFSNTLYESYTNAKFSIPFTSGLDFSGSPTIGALFYSPPTNASRFRLHDGSLVSASTIVTADYQIGPTGPGNFSAGMYCAGLYPE